MKWEHFAVNGPEMIVLGKNGLAKEVQFVMNGPEMHFILTTGFSGFCPLFLGLIGLYV